jgi:hypothetical protein
MNLSLIQMRFVSLSEFPSSSALLRILTMETTFILLGFFFFALVEMIYAFTSLLILSIISNIFRC